MNKTVITSIALTLSALAVPVAAQAAMMNYNMAPVSWPKVSWAHQYNVYYREMGAKKWTHAVRKLPSSSMGYTIRHLVPGIQYEYNVSALNVDGRENWWSGVKKLMTTSMK
ncbi:fibronectin type III domain-containing protein [Candidatus Gottesmanbacteria bacterium]|nr:fibronectin type III domain-containing protein [Candidatus Gottesmanbacteria bacterium]